MVPGCKNIGRMLSICIPVYNDDVTPLVYALASQGASLQVPFEIILIDDASDLPFRNKNEKLSPAAMYIQLTENIGRAKIRNLFTAHARYPYLLFLDCDVVLLSGSFLTNYVEKLKDGSAFVICGGRIYDSLTPDRSHRLRWTYGRKKESQPTEVRSQHPYQSFMTNNFIIRKEVLEAIRFDETLEGYGHEDTLFGYSLQKREIPVSHIHNPVLNGHLESNEVYLKKTEEGVKNLARIVNGMGEEKEFIRGVSLLRFYQKIKALAPVLRIVFHMTKPFFLPLLKKGYVLLPLFDFYKLGLLMKYLHEHNE